MYFNEAPKCEDKNSHIVTKERSMDRTYPNCKEKKRASDMFLEERMPELSKDEKLVDQVKTHRLSKSMKHKINYVCHGSIM